MFYLFLLLKIFIFKNNFKLALLKKEHYLNKRDVKNNFTLNFIKNVLKSINLFCAKLFSQVGLVS